MTTRDWRLREGKAQAYFRDVNESTVADRDTRPGEAPPIDSYVCECSHRGCSDEIRMTRAEYEGVRGESERFAIALDHENPEIDRLVSENLRFAVVQVLYRPVVLLAQRTDRRRIAGPVPA